MTQPQTASHCSHNQQRAFQPDKLTAPRDFIMPKIKDSTPVVLEIGAGKGKHAVSFAIDNPDKRLIAIERTRNKFDAFQKQAINQNLTNLTPIHADAIAWIVHAIAPNSVTSIYILYPNPQS